MKKNKTSYFKISILIIISLILIIVGIVYSNKQEQNAYQYIPDNTEVEVTSSQGEVPQSQGVGANQNIDKSLGPAKVEDMIGGTNAEEFYQAPSTEKLLEGKEIEINK